MTGSRARSVALLAFVATLGVAEGARADPLPTPLDGIGDDLALAFRGTNLLVSGTAVAATGVMAFGGADHAIRLAVQENIVAPAYADAALYAGYLVPALVAPGLYLVGLVARDTRTEGAGAAAIQALGLTLATTTLLKLAVGRVYPLNGGDPNAPDRLSHPAYAHTFEPFGGVLAWPSGHTSATVSIAAALTAYYPENVLVPLVGYPLALGIGFGMMVGDRHWASDVVAGALLGHVLGYSVGRGFRQRGRAADTAGLHLVPVAVPGGFGVGVGADW